MDKNLNNLQKWEEVVLNFDKFYSDNYKELRKLVILNGIPDHLRPYIWQKLAKSKYIESKDNLFAKYLNRNRKVRVVTVTLQVILGHIPITPHFIISDR